MFQKETIVDCKGHLLGRLASIIAKEILNGQKVVCVRCEEINMSGAIWRNKLKYANFKRKRMGTKPSHGHFHFRAPSKILFRTVRGMVPHKTTRGAMAMDRLKSFDGIPHPYDEKKRVVVPAALKALRLKPHRKFSRLGDLSKEFGWKSHAVLARLEEKRKVKSMEFYKKRLADLKAKAKTAKGVQKDLEKAIGSDKKLVDELNLA